MNTRNYYMSYNLAGSHNTHFPFLVFPESSVVRKNGHMGMSWLNKRNQNSLGKPGIDFAIEIKMALPLFPFLDFNSAIFEDVAAIL